MLISSYINEITRVIQINFQQMLHCSWLLGGVVMGVCARGVRALWCVAGPWCSAMRVRAVKLSGREIKEKLKVFKKYILPLKNGGRALKWCRQLAASVALRCVKTRVHSTHICGLLCPYKDASRD